MKVADLFVDLKLDISGFGAELSSAVSSAARKAGAIVIPVTVDTSKMNAEVSSATTTATRKAGTITVPVAADVTKVTSTVTSAATDATRKAGNVVIPVTANVSGMVSEVTTAARKAGSEGGDALTDEMSKAGKEAGDEAGSSLGSALSSAKGKIIAGAAIIGAGIAVGLGKAVSDSMDFEAANDKMAASLGLGGKAADQAGRVAGKLYAGGFGDSMGAVSEAVGVVIKNMDGMRNASEKTLTAVATKALTVSDVFDQDLTGTVNAASQLMKTGLAKNSSEAFDIITKGLQSGADKSGDFLDTINEYSTQFRKLGLTGKDSIGLISQMLKGGARDSDIAADAIKEFSIRSQENFGAMDKKGRFTFNELGGALIGSLNLKGTDDQLIQKLEKVQDTLAKGGPKAREMFGKITEGFGAMDASVSKNKGGVALFGTQFEDLGGAIDKIDLKTASKGMGDLAGATDKAGKSAYENSQSNITVLVRSLQTLAVDVIGGKLIPAITSLTGFMAENKALFVSLGAIVATAAAGLLIYSATVKAVTAVTAAWNVVQKLLNGTMKLNPIGLVVTALTLLVGGLILAYKNSETFRNIVNKAWAGIKAAISGAWNGIKAVFDALKNALGAVGTAFGKVVDFIKRVWGGLRKIFSDAVEAVKLVISRFIEHQMQRWTFLFNAVKNTVTNGWNKIKEIFTSAFDKVKEFVSTRISNIKTNWSNFFTAIKEAATNGWNKIKEIFTGAFDKVKEFVSTRISNLKTNWSNFFTSLKNTASDVWEKIRGVFTTAFDKIKGGFSSAVDAIKTVWNKIKEFTAKPVNFVIGTVYNDGIRVAINKVLGLIGKDPLGKVSELKGYARGGWTGAGPKMQPAGIVHADEHVWTKDEMKRFPGGHRGMEMMRASIRRGLPGYFLGGGVKPAAGAVSRHSGYSWAKWAGDINEPGASDIGHPVVAYKAGVISAVKHLTTSYGTHIRMNNSGGENTLYAHLSRVLVKAGQKVSAGQKIGEKGATGNVTGPHLHFELAGGSNAIDSSDTGGGGGGGSPDYSKVRDLEGKQGSALSLLNPAAWAAKLKSMGPFGSMISGIAGSLGGKAKSFITEKFGALIGAAKKAAEKAWSAAKGAAGAVGDFLTGGGDDSIHDMLKKGLKAYGWDDSGNFAALSRLIQSESGFNPKAENPTSTASGLFQMIDGTARAYGLPGHASNSSTAAQITAGMKYIKSRYGSPAKAWAFHTQHGYYDRGGWLQRGRTLTTNNTGKPEAVLTSGQWQQMERLIAVLDRQAGGRSMGAPLIAHATIRETVDLEAYERQRAFRERSTRV